MRLNRYLARAGVASRRKCDELILEGRISVNGETVTELGVSVSEDSDVVLVDGKKLDHPTARRYYLLFKPEKCLSAVSDDRDRKTVIDLIGESDGLHPVGRLDYDTTGVLILTDDGDLTYSLTHPSFEIERTYRTVLNRGFNKGSLDRLKAGIKLDDGPVKAEKIEWKGGKVVTLTLREGRNRVVKRIFEKLGFRVARLHRTRFGFLTTDGLDKGEWRELSAAEVNKLKGIN